MGAVTARDVLALLERRGARLVAGSAGSDRTVTWASAMRARPPAFENLQGGELALVSLATLRMLRAQDESLTLERLIQDLAERGVAAIAVAGLLAPADPSAPPPGPADAAEDRAATSGERALADALRLPLLALPAGALLSEVERDVIAFVVAERTAASEPRPEAPRDAYDALMRASLRGDDDRALGQRLTGILGVAIALEDAEDVRWCATPEDFPLAREALLALLRRPSARAAVRALVAGVRAGAAHSAPLAPGYARALVPLAAGHGEPEADPHPTPVVLTAIFPAATPAHMAAIEPAAPALVEVLCHVAPLFALALTRRQDAEDAERRLRAEALDALLAGTYPDESRMRLRAAQLGHDLSLPHVALVVELGPAPTNGAVAAPPALARAAAAIAQALAVELAGTWARARDGEVAALVPVTGGAPATELPALAQRAAAAVAVAAGDVMWAAGIGEAAIGAVEMRRSHHEARDTARLGRSLMGPGQVARVADLGIYRLLLRLRESGELEDFTRRTLGPLLGETRGAHDLLATLEAYFASNGNHSLAARRLALHRNSLIYRLNRARTLLGYDLDEPEARLALQLALKARRVLSL